MKMLKTSRNTSAAVPQPHPMPVDAESYEKALSITTFINAYYQIRDILTYSPKKVLVIGVGVGLEPLILRSKFSIDVTTLDIDARFKPDDVGSVHDLRLYRDKQFDVVVASHVLEHLPFSYFDTCLDELARVGHHAIIYLPYAGRKLELRLVYAQRVRECSLRLTVPPLARISGNSPVLQAKQHYWECGYRGFSVAEISRRISRRFRIDERYRNRDWAYSVNFRLTANSAD